MEHKQVKCKKCGKMFTPSYGEFSRCKSCLADEHTAGEKATHTESFVKLFEEEGVIDTPAPETPEPKAFKVVSVSKNPNNFGLHGHVLVAQDGEAWEVGRSRGAWNDPWDQGATIHIGLDKNGRPNWSKMSVEIPRQLPTAPPDVVSEIWG